jgi:predicted DNA-binding ribbon-helix-helix protein
MNCAAAGRRQGAEVAASRLINRNVLTERGRTSMRLEPELWDALREISVREHQNIHGLVRHIEALGYRGGRTSAVRVFVLQYFRAAANEASPAGPPTRSA